jgi:hypothetical protein
MAAFGAPVSSMPIEVKEEYNDDGNQSGGYDGDAGDDDDE